ncbi:hypothetical protein HED60_08800 [Planctomycetales bacterium ZRK34]|nr:hypothetical protein HED60_08800 [Planctomycetales bacterium ZRK34]
MGEPTAGQLINPAAFVAALRAGWTLGEALAVAAPVINSNLRMIGDPLARILLPLQGYNIYSRPVLDAVDELIAVAPAGATEYVAKDFDPGSSRIISVRAANRLGREDDEALHARLASFDDAGNLNAQMPNPVIDLQLTNLAGTVTARWMYRANSQVTAPDHYAVYTAVDGAAFDYGAPDYTLAHASRYVHEITVGNYSDGQQLRVAVETVDAAGGASPRRFAEISIDAAAPDDPQSIDVEVTNE